MQLANVQTQMVGGKQTKKKITVTGKVQPDERLVFTQSAHIPGRIEELKVSFTGQYLKEGQQVASVYSAELVTAQKELLEAFKIKESQPALFQAAKEKLKNWKLTEAQINEILQAQKVTERFPVLANVSGYVLDKKINLGDYVKTGQPLYRVASLERVWLLFDVYEPDLQWVRQGDKITYSVASLPGETFTGTITYLDPTIDPQTRVAKARVESANPNGRLKPEMFATGQLSASLKGGAEKPAIPKSAVMWTGKRSVVYVKQQTDQGVSFSLREVTLGASLGESYLIESGLEAGEEIAVNGTFSIDAAAQLAGKPSMMNKEGGVAMTGHHNGNTAPASQKKPEPIQKVSISTKAKTALQPLFDQYFKLKEALTKDDFQTAQAEGKTMKAELEKINMALFKGESHTVWMKWSNQLAKSLQHIGHHQEIGALRKAFMSISNAMIALTEAFRPLEETVYQQFCPMANNNQGADWLSMEKEVLNPYFGASMLKCGEVKKEFKN